MAAGDGRDPGEGELVEVPPPPHSRRSVALAAAVVVAVVALAGALVADATTGGGGDQGTTTTTAGLTTRRDSVASRLVAAAAETTSATGSYHVTFRLTQRSAAPTTPTTCPAAPTVPPTVTAGTAVIRSSAVAVVCAVRRDVTVTGDAVVNTNPTAMHITSNVSDFGPVTLIVDGTDVWEYGGADYGSDGHAAGPGASFSQFAGLVEGTLGRREGALAMQSMASPNGYLAITRATIADATPIGTGTVDGVPVTNYRVTIDPSAMPDGVTPEEATAITEARAILADEGFVHTVEDVSVDANGLIRHTTSVAMFRDGGTMTSDDTFSQFGCAGAVAVPGRSPGAPAGPPGCVVLPTPTATTTVTTAAPPTTAAPATVATTTSTTAAGTSTSTSTTTTTAATSTSEPSAETSVAVPLTRTSAR